MQFSRRHARIVLVLGIVAGSACEHAGEDRVLAVTATGVVLGTVFFDANGNRAADPGEPPYPAVGVRLVTRGTRDTVAKATSNRDGVYAIFGVPIGDYVVVVDTTGMGDSLRVSNSTPEIRLRPEDSVLVQIGVSFPIVTVAQARGVLLGKRVFVEAVALNSPASFGDSTIHILDASGSIRTTRVRPGVTTVGVGDSLRLLGRRNSRNGQPTLDDVSLIPLGFGLVPATPTISTANAAIAQGGALDARLVRIGGATVASTSTNSQGDLEITVNDGSGALIVALDAEAGLSTAGFTPGVIIDVVGLLVPTGAGDFRLKPRFNSDVVRH
jgi:hypothetical protein